MNVGDCLKMRLELKKSIRIFFENLNYLEVETPTIVVTPGSEVYLDYFETTWLDYKRKEHSLWLRSSPEIHMKQLLANDCDRIFQIARCFRNTGELSEWHHPEFDLLEWYQKSISYENFMEQTKDFLHSTLNIMKEKFPKQVSLTLPEKIEKISVKDAFYEIAKINLVDNDVELSKQAIEKKILSVNKNDDFETAYFKILLEKIEPEFQKIGAIILYDYPASQAALSKIENGCAKRFEFYIKGIELCNAFLEELDPKENEKRLQEVNKKRRILNRKIPAVDSNFIHSLNYKSSITCGNALGFDRWLALLLGQNNLENMIPFRNREPYIKQEGKI